MIDVVVGVDGPASAAAIATTVGWPSRVLRAAIGVFPLTTNWGGFQCAFQKISLSNFIDAEIIIYDMKTITLSFVMPAT